MENYSYPAHAWTVTETEFYLKYATPYAEDGAHPYELGLLFALAHQEYHIE